MHYKVLFITKCIKETEYDILMTAKDYSSGKVFGGTGFGSKKCNKNYEFNSIL